MTEIRSLKSAVMPISKGEKISPVIVRAIKKTSPPKRPDKSPFLPCKKEAMPPQVSAPIAKDTVDISVEREWGISKEVKTTEKISRNTAQTAAPDIRDIP